MFPGSKGRQWLATPPSGNGRVMCCLVLVLKTERRWKSDFIASARQTDGQQRGNFWPYRPSQHTHEHTQPGTALYRPDVSQFAGELTRWSFYTQAIRGRSKIENRIFQSTHPFLQQDTLGPIPLINQNYFVNILHVLAS